MFTDIVGYSRLTRRISEDDLRAVLADHERIVAEESVTRAGRVVKNLGDSFLVVFDSVGAAIDSALAFQRRVRARNHHAAPHQSFSLKVVIHAGDVDVGDDGDVFGDPVNLCARMEKAASAGEILLSEAAYLATNMARRPCEEFGIREFAGIDRPIKLFRLIQEREGSPRVERAIAFTEISRFYQAHELSVELAEELIGDHDGVFFECVAQHGGFVQSVFGDGTLFAFESAEQAVRALWSAMTDLARRNQVRSADQSLSVRAAIHWGQVLFIRGRMFGDAVNHGFELLASSQPMAITISKAARDQLPRAAGATFTAVEPLTIEGLDRPIARFLLEGLGGDLG